MRILRFDGTGGASGDMIFGALLALGASRETIAAQLEKLPLGAFHLHCEAHAADGVHGVRLSVECHAHEHEHHHTESAHRHGRTWRDIRAMLEAAELPERARELSLAVFGALAEAEASVHGVETDAVHFHEVGAADSIIDIVGSTLALVELGVDGVEVAPLATGCGTFRCAHGVYPIPAPATAELLRRFGLRNTPTEEESELLTPTGAALLGAWPHRALSADAVIVRSANSFGHRALKTRPNWLRATLYTAEAGETSRPDSELLEFACNLDDCTGEVLGATGEMLLAAGALDVWSVPIGMKKGRPGVQLSFLAPERLRETLLAILFRETTTFGVRLHGVQREELKREIVEVATPFGPIPVKIGYRRDEIVSRHPEFDACRAAAERANAPVKTVIRAAQDAAASATSACTGCR